MLKLDDRDLKILSILSREGRISKAELAKRVNLSAAPAWERLKRLEEERLAGGVVGDAESDMVEHRVAPVIPERGVFHALPPWPGSSVRPGWPTG